MADYAAGPASGQLPPPHSPPPAPCPRCLRGLEDTASAEQGSLQPQVGCSAALSSRLGGVLGQQGAGEHLLTVWASSWVWKRSRGCTWFSGNHRGGGGAVRTAGSAAGSVSEDGQAADPQGRDTECHTARSPGAAPRAVPVRTDVGQLGQLPQEGQGPQRGLGEDHSDEFSQSSCLGHLQAAPAHSDGQLLQLTRPPGATAAGPGAAAGLEQRPHQLRGRVQWVSHTSRRTRPQAPELQRQLGPSSHRPPEGVTRGSASTSSPPRSKGQGRRQGLEPVRPELQGHQAGEVAQVPRAAPASLGHSGPGEPG